MFSAFLKDCLVISSPMSAESFLCFCYSSPHNMDKTATFMHEATEFFVNENVTRFILGDTLLNPVDARLGY